MKLFRYFKNADKSFKKNMITLFILLGLVIAAIAARVAIHSYDRFTYVLFVELAIVCIIMSYMIGKQIRNASSFEAFLELWNRVVPIVYSKYDGNNKRFNQVMNIKSTEYLHEYDKKTGLSVERIDRSTKRKLIAGPSFEPEVIANQIIEYVTKK